MYKSLIKDYLTHYQPELKAELTAGKTLQTYLEQQAEAMFNTRNLILIQLETDHPRMSLFQREIEADQRVREIFLSLP